MTKDRHSPLPAIQDLVARHQEDLAAVPGMEWLAEVLGLLREEVGSVPAPAERIDAIPKYIYPH